MLRCALPVFVVMLASAVEAAGSIAGPASYIAPSSDGRQVFVMLWPRAVDDRTPPARLSNGRMVDLHTAFPASGLYDVATLRPVWQVNWFSYPWDLLWSDDLRHIVRVNPNGFRSNWAIAFYSDGQLVRAYDCPTLLPRMNSVLYLPFTTSGWHMVWCNRCDLDETHQSVRLSTERRQLQLFDSEIDLGRQEFYTFDLATGAMTSRRTARAWVPWAYGVGAVGVLATSAAFAALTLRLGWRMLRGRRSARGFPVSVSTGTK